MPAIQTSDGTRLHYQEVGSGPPLVFAHEFAGDARSWEPQLRRFSRTYRCIAYCARGYPPSDVPPGEASYSQEHARDDLLAVIDGLRLERPHVVGLSMGGFAALHLGMRHCARGQPPRARSLVIAGVGNGAHPAQRRGFQESARAGAATLRALGMAQFAAAFGSGPTRVQYREKDPRGFEEYTRMLAEHSAEGSAHTLAGYLAGRPSLYDLTDDLAQVDVPVLVLAGDEDEPCLETSLLLKRAIPRAGLAVLPKSGHALNAEEPERFNQLLEDFFHRVESGRWGERDRDAALDSLWGPAGKPA